MKELDAGKDAPKEVVTFIEISKGSNVKYEMDEEHGVMKVDRILHTSMVYPWNYGFVPGTLGEDGDPLDMMVISTAAFVPGSIVKVRPIGVLLMKDEEGVDSKIMAVPTGKIDPDFKDVNDISQMPQHLKDMIGHFFSYYKSIEPGKWAKVEGWKGSKEAQEFVTAAMQRAKKKK